MNNKIIYLFVFLSSFLIFSANLGGLTIYSLDEAKNAECAREMLERGDLIVPTFNYELRTDKPPMHYYFMMLSYKLFGVNEFASRFFSAIFGALTVLITFLIAKRYLGYKVAFFSFVSLISSIHLSIQFHMAVPDPYLIFWINAALFSFFVGFKEKKSSFIYLFYIFMGLGVLTKGPVAVVLPTGIVILYLILRRELTLENIKFLKPFQGIILTGLVSIPWYVAVYIKTDGKWVHDFIFKHNIHRFSEPMEGHGGIFLVTLIFIFIGMLPFTVFILQILKNSWKHKYNDLILFSLIIVFLYTLFFSISSTKLPNYTVPLYPALSILIGLFIKNIYDYSIRSLSLSIYFYIFLWIVIIIGLYFGVRNEPEISDLSYLSFYFILLPISGILALIFLKKSKTLTVLTLSTFSIFVGLLFFYHIFPKIDQRNPVVQIIPYIKDDGEVRYYKNFNPAFVYYLRKHIKPITIEELKNSNPSNKKIYILTRKKYLKELEHIKGLKVVKEVKDLFENKTSVLVIKK
ncbi:phospholipid carrier-dependent glycosyltransferase [Persephonella sp.]